MIEELTEQKAIRYAKSTLIITGILMFFALFLLFYFLKYCPYCGKEIYTIVESGQFGDSFNGVLAPIISICAAILTFLAFYIQYEANKIQRKGLIIQQFDSTFFHLVSNHSEIVNAIKEYWDFDPTPNINEPLKKEPLVGRELFKKVACAVKEIFDETISEDVYGSIIYRIANNTQTEEELQKRNPLYYIKFRVMTT